VTDSHHEESFWRKYIFSTDHKIIGIQYGITALLFLFFGFSLMMVMRWQLAYPDTSVPVVGGLVKWLAERLALIDGEEYNKQAGEAAYDSGLVRLVRRLQFRYNPD